MIYKNLRQCLNELYLRGDLIVIDQEIDACLEAGVIQKKVFNASGPALLFTRVKNCSFPMAANIFGTLDRVRYIFRHNLNNIKKILSINADPKKLLKNPDIFFKIFRSAYNAIPKKVSDGPILANKTQISNLPQLKTWPKDAGAFITLPQVYSESLSKPGLLNSNIGMYRIQLSGGEYKPDKEAGLHYQIHRGIGFHHAEAISKNKKLNVNIFIGGPPAMSLAAVMPLPEGIPEVSFAGILSGHRIPFIIKNGFLPILAEADFCITGSVSPNKLLPEGPFGDHLGYYSLVHNFPVIDITNVYHRKDAIWPFTTVGRPPQEDSILGAFIHEITSDFVKVVFSGIHQVNAVDASGVHPLLLAIGSERYVPHVIERSPQELLTGALSLLGNTQTSLSKYVIISAFEDNPDLNANNISDFFCHILERVDWRKDIHFITQTTMDTLDYSGISLNQGSKVIIAACGRKKRELGTSLPPNLKLPDLFKDPIICLPGIFSISCPAHKLEKDKQDKHISDFCQYLAENNDLDKFPLIVISDDSSFTSKNLNNFLWVTFTRSDPATDIYGTNSFINCKHWGCNGTLIIDARIKSHHAPELIQDPEVEKKINELGKRGGPLYKII